MNDKEKEDLLNNLREDKVFLKEVVTAIVSDKAMMATISKSVLLQPIAIVGIADSGTIAEYFQKESWESVQPEPN